MGVTSSLRGDVDGKFSRALRPLRGDLLVSRPVLRSVGRRGARCSVPSTPGPTDRDSRPRAHRRERREELREAARHHRQLQDARDDPRGRGGAPPRARPAAGGPGGRRRQRLPRRLLRAARQGRGRGGLRRSGRGRRLALERRLRLGQQLRDPPGARLRNTAGLRLPAELRCLPRRRLRRPADPLPRRASRGRHRRQLHPRRRWPAAYHGLPVPLRRERIRGHPRHRRRLEAARPLHRRPAPARPTPGSTGSPERAC